MGFMQAVGNGTIPIQSITRVLASNKLSTRLLVVKVVAEGADGLVLRTLLGLLQGQDTLVMYEISNMWYKHQPAISQAATVTALEGAGYNVYLFGSADWAVPRHFFLRMSAEHMTIVTPSLRWEAGVALKRDGATLKALRPLRDDEFVSFIRNGSRSRESRMCNSFLKKFDQSNKQPFINCFRGRFFTVDPL